MNSLDHVKCVFDALPYNWSTFELDDFSDFISTYRNKKLFIYRQPIDLSISAVCIAYRSADFIFLNSRRASSLRIHYALHEIGHLLLGHMNSIRFATDQDDLKEQIKSLGANLRAYIPQNDIQSENEAEYFVYLAQETIKQNMALHNFTLSDTDPDLHIPPFTKLKD